MTPPVDLKAEIETILRTADDDNRHAMAFRGMCEGFDAEQIAKEWDRSASYATQVMRSVRCLLNGRLPQGASIVLTNSYAYRESLDCCPSDALRTHVMTRLRELRERNREVKLEPMVRVGRSSRAGPRKSTRET